MALHPEWKPLLDHAKKAIKNAYTPYSGFKVGSAVEFADGSVHSGCNIENASYGATLCAERVAIFSGLRNFSEASERKINRVLVFTPLSHPAAPCGLCLQVIAEFASDDVPVMLVGKDESRAEIYRFGDLLPKAFRPSDLKAD